MKVLDFGLTCQLWCTTLSVTTGPWVPLSASQAALWPGHGCEGYFSAQASGFPVGTGYQGPEH